MGHSREVALGGAHRPPRHPRHPPPARGHGRGVHGARRAGRSARGVVCRRLVGVARHQPRGRVQGERPRAGPAPAARRADPHRRLRRPAQRPRDAALGRLGRRHGQRSRPGQGRRRRGRRPRRRRRARARSSRPWPRPPATASPSATGSSRPRRSASSSRARTAGSVVVSRTGRPVRRRGEAGPRPRTDTQRTPRRPPCAS